MASRRSLVADWDSNLRKIEIEERPPIGNIPKSPYLFLGEGFGDLICEIVTAVSIQKCPLQEPKICFPRDEKYFG